MVGFPRQNLLYFQWLSSEMFVSVISSMMARSYLIGPPGWGMDQRPSARREPRVMGYFFAEETMNLFFQRRSK